MFLPRLISWCNGMLLAGYHETLIVGDSHVAFAGRHDLKIDATFMGVPGACVKSTHARLARGEFKRVTCDTLIVALGTNDIAPWCSPAAAAARVYALALLLGDHVHATRIMLHGAFGQEAFNRELARYVDHTDVFYLAPPTPTPNTLCPDGVHLNARGYLGWSMFLRWSLNLPERPAKTLPRWFWRLIDSLVTMKQHA